MFKPLDFPEIVVTPIDPHTMILMPRVSLADMQVLLEDRAAMAEFAKRCVVLKHVGEVSNA